MTQQEMLDKLAVLRHACEVPARQHGLTVTEAMKIIVAVLDELAERTVQFGHVGHARPSRRTRDEDRR